MAGDTARNIAKGSYGDRFGRGASNETENKNQGEDGHATRRTKESVKRASNLMKSPLRRSVLHKGNTGEQFLRHAKR